MWRLCHHVIAFFDVSYTPPIATQMLVEVKGEKLSNVSFQIQLKGAMSILMSSSQSAGPADRTWSKIAGHSGLSHPVCIPAANCRRWLTWHQRTIFLRRQKSSTHAASCSDSLVRNQVPLWLCSRGRPGFDGEESQGSVHYSAWSAETSIWIKELTYLYLQGTR